MISILHFSEKHLKYPSHSQVLFFLFQVTLFEEREGNGNSTIDLV